MSVAGMLVGELIKLLERYPPEAKVVLSVGGHQLPEVHIGVTLHRPTDEAVIAIAHRQRFAGRLPDMLLER
jgi:tRNA(His) 5'-end guanylyltransferase